MKINQIKNAQNFSGLYNNKFLLSSLEHISNHGASFVSCASFVGAVGLRPLAISLPPKTNDENKKVLSADSIASGLVKLLIALGISLPVEKMINSIVENPKAFLKPETIENLSKNQLDFINQSIKMGSNLLSAIPKSILGVALIPIILDLFKKPQKKDNEIIQRQSFESFKKQRVLKEIMLKKLFHQ